MCVSSTGSLLANDQGRDANDPSRYLVNKVFARSGSTIVSTRFVLVMVYLSATGCAVGPDFVTPPAPVATEYLGVNNRSVVSKQYEYCDWWKVFQDPTLNQLINIAYNQNLTLLSAGARVLAALGIAIGEFYPQLQQGTGLLTDNRASQAGPSADPVPAELFQKIERLKERVAELENKLGLPPKTQDNLRKQPSPLKYYGLDSLAMHAAWELDFCSKFRRGVESADAVYLASIAIYDDVLVTLLADVAATYIGIRTIEKQIEIAQANVRRQREALRCSKA